MPSSLGLSFKKKGTFKKVQHRWVSLSGSNPLKILFTTLEPKWLPSDAELF
jgi:hypothetical protein